MKEKRKLVISILIVAIFIQIIGIIRITNQNNKYKEKVNIVIASIVGEISQKYPGVDEKEIIEILNKDNSQE